MNGTATRSHQKRTETAEPSLIDAAKVVVSLSGWGTPQGAPPNVKAFMTSAMAVQVLRDAIEREENPVLRLAPEPLPMGL